MSDSASTAESITTHSSCPMCGANLDPGAPRCDECGETFQTPTTSPSELDRKRSKLNSERSGLAAMYFCGGIFSMFLGWALGGSWLRRSMDWGGTYFVLFFCVGIGLIPIAMAVNRSHVPTIRVAMIGQLIVAIILCTTLVLSPVGLFLILGVLQSRRVLRLIRELDEEEGPQGE